jgi:hypothetical protein
VIAARWVLLAAFAFSKSAVAGEGHHASHHMESDVACMGAISELSDKPVRDIFCMNTLKFSNLQMVRLLDVHHIKFI